MTSCDYYKSVTINKICECLLHLFDINFYVYVLYSVVSSNKNTRTYKRIQQKASEFSYLQSHSDSSLLFRGFLQA